MSDCSGGNGMFFLLSVPDFRYCLNCIAFFSVLFFQNTQPTQQSRYNNVITIIPFEIRNCFHAYIVEQNNFCIRRRPALAGSCGGGGCRCCGRRGHPYTIQQWTDPASLKECINSAVEIDGLVMCKFKRLVYLCPVHYNI